MERQRPAFIISFDCEGKWGMADKINEHHNRTLSNPNLNRVYRRLVNLLDEYGVKATFAFVGAYLLSPDEYCDHLHWFRDIPIAGRNWVERFQQGVAVGCFDGWLNPESLRIVQQSGRHEIGSHGFTHVPLAENRISRAEFLHEMTCVRHIARIKQLPLQTLVYPRNAVGYTADLPSCGIWGYRENLLAGRPRLLAARNIGREFNVLQQSQSARHSQRPIPIPSGYFLNWRHGARRRIPIRLTVARWSQLLRHAVRSNGIVHLWSHPWNFIDGQNQFELFEQILNEASGWIQSGQLDNLTQLDYCKRFDRGVERNPQQRAA